MQVKSNFAAKNIFFIADRKIDKQNVAFFSLKLVRPPNASEALPGKRECHSLACLLSCSPHAHAKSAWTFSVRRCLARLWLLPQVNGVDALLELRFVAGVDGANVCVKSHAADVLGSILTVVQNTLQGR